LSDLDEGLSPAPHSGWCWHPSQLCSGLRTGWCHLKLLLNIMKILWTCCTQSSCFISWWHGWNCGQIARWI